LICADLGASFSDRIAPMTNASLLSRCMGTTAWEGYLAVTGFGSMDMNPTSID